MLSGLCLKSVTTTSCDNHVMQLENTSFESLACFLFRTSSAGRAGRAFHSVWFMRGYHLRRLRATPAQKMEIGVCHSPVSPPSTHRNYFHYLSNAILNYMACRPLKIRTGFTMAKWYFSFLESEFNFCHQWWGQAWISWQGPSHVQCDWTTGFQYKWNLSYWAKKGRTVLD